jgi:CelD/BcsL family acetyltransferase involved in cellulose biosynthesis
VEPSEIRTRPEELAGAVEEWRRLAAGCDNTSYFLSPDWVLGWWETLGHGRTAEVAIWRDPSGGLEGIVPLIQVEQRLHRRVPLAVRVWTNMGSGIGGADHCGWPVLSGRVDHARAWIERKSARAAMLLKDLDPELGVPFVPDSARRLTVSACPRLVIPPEGQELAVSSKFRKQLAAYTRKLARQGVEFRWVDPAQMSDSLLETVFRLHERRWSVAQGTSSFTRSRAALHRQLISRGGPDRGPAVVLAERGGQPVGVLYGFRWRDVFAYYQTGWEPEWAAANLGTVLVSEAIRLAGQAGARVFDFLRGAESYKYRFGAVDRIDETWLVPRGAHGRLLGLQYRVKDRLRREARAAA